MNPKQYWDNAAKDPDVRHKYIADEWAKTEHFIELLENNNHSWFSVWEIGCGIGRLLEPLSKKYKHCDFYGTDISSEMIKLAPKRKNIHYYQPENKLDLVYSFLVFQHITHTEKLEYIERTHQLLRPAGTMIFQFVKGKEYVPYSYQMTDDDINNMLSLCKNKFRSITIGSSPLHKDWGVAKLVK